jgi:hypothetical protein
MARVATAIRTNVAVSLAVVAIVQVIAAATVVAPVVVKAQITVDFVTATGDAGLTNRAWSTEPYVVC